MKFLNLKLALVALAISASSLSATYTYESGQALIDLKTNHIATSVNLGVGDDRVSGAFNLGFTFDFYGQAFTQARMATNGCLHFKTSGSFCTGGSAISLRMSPSWTVSR